MKKKKFKVCIDAGHFGKYNQSPVVKAYYESVFNWKMANYLKENLIEYGCEVILTRNNINKDLSVFNRGAMSIDCDLFLSIHSNSSDSSKTDYVVVIRGFNELETDKLALLLAKKIDSVMGTVQNAQTWTKKQNNNYDEYYGVLRGARSVNTKYRYIIEHSFHTNKKSTLFLLKDENIQTLAIEESKVIANYFGLKKISSSIPNNNKNKLARIIVENLNVRKIPDWKAKPCEVVHYGDCFTIADTVSAKNGDTKMYKLKSGLYITASKKYVEIFIQ